MIFGYYSEFLQNLYLTELERTAGLAACITAYRRILHPSRLNTSMNTVHFAHEVFQEVSSRASQECWVLKFDVDSFFSSMDHRVLKQSWATLLQKTTLPDDHYNVFKAATKFSFILKDDLRIRQSRFKRREGFDEKLLSENRKQGTNAFFHNPKAFRKRLAEKTLRIYKNTFRNDEDEMIGIPQGLPISATLANIYLLEFDKLMFEEVVINRKGFYRRYSDDIIVICGSADKEFLIDFVSKALKEVSKVNASIEKTEQYFFKLDEASGKPLSHVFRNGSLVKNIPLTYLGFEFYGHKTLIKSANLSKFYRRMIDSVKSRTKRAVLSAKNNPGLSMAIYKRRLFRLYTNVNLDKKLSNRRFRTLVPGRYGYSVVQTTSKKKKFASNYFSYVNRAAQDMEDDSIRKQIRRHRTIFNQAIVKHLKKALEKYT
ncbi:reverse transcriptase domain-containing protein [Pedobacter sp. G11]|uniref:reverse transcriptase domain-containing protein n=1 Tax=Pedobacter sp. G11 TaxID=2482728 RepID=UPI00143CC49D|nr:reverse transcriptase domain-containing protein [Pedobacter sp. G11]